MKEGTGGALVYLIGCALNGIAAGREQLENVDEQDLYKTAGKHHVRALCAAALRDGGHLDEGGIFAGAAGRWKKALKAAVIRNMRFDAERGVILEYFEKAGIWYLPLKGILLHRMYPELGLREMADNDILFDAGRCADVRDFMKARGYEVRKYGEGAHDVYVKPPLFNFEFHRYLFGGYYSRKQAEYFRETAARMIRDEDNSFGYHLSDEDFYIYFVAHAYKHHSGAGTGIRTYADDYVYRKAKGAALDFSYIDRELEKLGLTEYSQALRKAGDTFFSPQRLTCGGEMDGETLRLLRYALGSGAYGNTDNRVINRFSGLLGKTGSYRVTDKLRYLIRRMFPDREFMLGYAETFAPFFCRHQWLLPLAYPYRLVTKFFVHHKIMKKELESLRRLKEGGDD